MISGGAEAVLAVAIYLGALLAFLSAPHLATAATVALFAFIPALKVFVAPQAGGVKDVVVLAAISAAVVVFAFEQRRPDRWVGILVLLLLGLYVVNVGGGHGDAWAQGLRLTGEPLLLLLVGFVLPNPQRNLRYALGALVAVGCIDALYGLLQQAVGQWTLVSWGYSFKLQVRTINGMLRSFGTFDDPFEYAAFLLFALAAVLFWIRRGALAWVAGAVLLLGLGASLVRTAVLVLIGFAGIQLIRWRHTTLAVLAVTAACVVAGVTLANPNGTGTNGPALNGRISAWQAAIGTQPTKWLLGRGVGAVGTAAARASSPLIPTSNAAKSDSAQAVDSGYVATIADVGLVGLGVLLALFWRLIVLSSRAARRGQAAGWIAAAILAAMMLDALTRASFNGFPTAFVGFLIVGIALAAADADRRAPSPTATG